MLIWQSSGPELTGGHCIGPAHGNRLQGRILLMPATEDARRVTLVDLTCALAAAPAAWLVLFGLFILRARLTIGRWPTPSVPDPKDLGFDLHHAAIVVGVPFIFVAVFLVIVLKLPVNHRPKRQWSLSSQP